MAVRQLDRLPFDDGSGEINPKLMSFARLFKDDIAKYFKTTNSAPLYQKFSELLGRPEFAESAATHPEVFMDHLLKSQSAFRELHDLIREKMPQIYKEMHLFNVQDETVFELFDKYFLCPAPVMEYEMKKSALTVMEEAVAEEDEEVREFVHEENPEGRSGKDEVGDSESYDTASEGEERKSNDQKDEGIDVEDEYVAPPVDRYITVLDKVACAFDYESFRDITKHTFKELQDVPDPLQQPSHLPVRDTRPWARHALRLLPFIRSSHSTDKDDILPPLMFNFVKALTTNSRNRVCLLYLMPDYKRRIAEKEDRDRARISRGERVHKAQKDAPDFRNPSMYHKFVAPKRGVQGQDYQTPRDYQNELKERACKGENIVIVAPTGSGKTNIAAEIIIHHHRSRKERNLESRVVFIVPKIPLADQQAKKFCGFLSDDFNVDCIHGEYTFRSGAPPRNVSFLASNVIVMTPQILINMLTSIRHAERVYVSDISLILLDECHHTTAKHAYAELMDVITDFDPKRKPQIVGLTASLGVGKGGHLVEHAMNHIYELCARMGTTGLSTARQYKKNLDDHVNKPDDVINHVRRFEGGAAVRLEENAPFTNKILQIMTKIFADMGPDLLKLCRKNNPYGVELKKELLFADKSQTSLLQTERFNGRMDCLKQDLKNLNDSEMKMHLMKGINVLKAYSACLATNDLLPAHCALDELDAQMASILLSDRGNYAANQYRNEHRQILSDYSVMEQKKPMLKALKDEIENQFKKDADSRVIVFVSTRDLTEQLSGYIDRMEILPFGKHAGYLISSKARGRMTAPTPKEQALTLAEFRDGTKPIIVATTVAEEGLDFKECNLIIKYNMTGNVISLKQQRGRARAKESRHVLLVLDDSVKQRELANHMAERMMNLCVDSIHKMGADALKMKVEELQRGQRARREAELAQDAARKETLKKIWDIVCKSCGSKLTQSLHIRQSHSHYVVVDTDIWDKLLCLEDILKTKYIDSTTTIAARMHCGHSAGSGEKCAHPLGKVIKYYGCYFPSFDVSAIQLRDMQTGLIQGTDGMSKAHNKSWDEMGKNSFYIAKLDDDNREEMLDTLAVAYPDLYQQLEFNCRQTAEKIAREAKKQKEAEGRRAGGDMADSEGW